MTLNQSDRPVRVRFAPSPTGHLHVGTARTGVFNWLFARQTGGTFILRLEDTDRVRSKDEFVDSIVESMKWLGLDWDEGPIFQSQRLELYQEAADKLLHSGKAYRCFCTAEELETMRNEAMAAGRNPRYDSRCRRLTDEQREKLAAEGRAGVLRIAIPETGVTSYEDLVLGKLQKGNDELDDFVILRSDRTPTYNFVCAVDDAEMKISHVIRGNDHITNTFKQILVYDALGLEPPAFAHLPLILGKDKKKISKRKGAVSVIDFKAEGYLAETMVNFLALLGWSPGDDREFMPGRELISAFSLERVTSANPVFDPDKLAWLNGEYIRAMDDNKLLTLLQPLIMESGLATRLEIESRWHWMLKIVAALKERMRLLTDFLELSGYFFRGELTYDPKGVKKHFHGEDAVENLEALQTAFAAIPENRFNKESSEHALRSLAEERGLKVAKFIHPLRLALSGTTKGPGMFEITEILGRETCLERINRAIAFIKTNPPS